MKTKTTHAGPASKPVLSRDPSLTELEQRLYEELAAEIRAGRLDADAGLWSMDYIKEPPSMETFLLDDYYLGKSWRPIPGENEGIWPAWLELLSKDLNISSRIHNLVITGSLGIGKCLCYNELCLMFDGSIKPVQDIKVGDTLMGDDSTPRRVLSTTTGRGPMYQVYPAKGEPFGCNDAHILCLKSSVSDEVEHVSVKDFLKWPRQKRHQARLYRSGCNWQEQPIALDPYWLGLWLGDGNTNAPILTTADPEIAAYHTKYAAQHGLEITVGVDKRGNAANTYAAVVKDRRQARLTGNPLRKKLGAYGMCAIDGSQEKHIPDEYLFNSRDIRLNLLAGLLDTDGSKSSGGKRTAKHAAKKSNGVYEITVKLEKLANQIRFLAQSLGYFAQTKIKICNSAAYYRTTISGAYDVPSLLIRKQSGEQGSATSSITGHIRKADCLKTKFAVIPKGEGDYYGFELDGNHRFLLKDFTVSHNTSVMVALLLYRICLATHLKNPQNFFGLSRNSNIVYNLLSVTKEAVKDTAFGTAMDYMADSAYFLEVCKFDPDCDYSDYRIPMLNTLPDGRVSHIWLTGGSKGQHVLGRNLLGIGLDEGNFRLEKDPDLKAYELYDQVRTRIANRFQKIESYLPAISIIASSAQDESSFTEKVVKEIEEANRRLADENAKILDEASKTPPTQLVVRNAVYRIKRHALTGITPDHHWFRVAYGLKNMEPYILSGWYREDGTPILDELHEEPPTGARTELVPKFYFEAFKRNTKAQLQNLSGISTGGAHRLFSSLIDIETCLEVSKQEGVPDPLLTGTQRFPISSEDDKHVWDYLNHKSFLTRVSSRVIPIRQPNNMRYAHIDLATQTLAGVSVCHLAGTQLVDGLVKDGQPFQEYRLIVEYDFILTICAGNTKPINIGKIQKFFFWLRDMCGYQFGLITADMFQCLTGDTLVDTDHGLLPLAEVKPGYRVQDANGQPAKVIRNFRYSNVPVLRIVTNHNEVICGTPNHRLRAATNCQRPFTEAIFGWKRLDELKPGDILDQVSSPVCVRGTEQETRAEWLGLYWGNGCLKASSGSVTLSCAKRHVAEAVAITAKATQLQPKVYWSENGQSAEVAVHSRALVRQLIAEGYEKAPQKSGKSYASVGLPLPILKSNRTTQAAFLRGLFSADGTVDKLGTVSLSTKHQELAGQTGVILRTQFGLRSNLVRSFRKGYGKKRCVQWILQVGGSRQTFRAEIGFCYSSKQAKLDKHTSKKGRRLVTRVARLETGMADVYDLEVETTHSYTANGFISHNSEAPLQELEARGFKVNKLSVDRDKSVYTSWRTGFEEQRIRLPRNEQMVREAAELLEMDKKFDHPPDGCFTGETEVKLLNGTTLSLTEMAKRGGTYWVYGNDGTGKIIPVKAFNARKTKTVNSLLEITIDNGKTVRCTPDHKFLTRDGIYLRADQLMPKTSLMPLYTKLYKVKYQRGAGYYEQVWSEGNWRMTHKLVADYLGFSARQGEVIHHASLNSLNNDPDQLERLTKSEHNRRHILISKVTSSPEVVKRRVETFKLRYSHNTEWLKKKAKTGRTVYKNMTLEQKTRLITSTQTSEASERTRQRNLERWASSAYRAHEIEKLTRYAKSPEGRLKSSVTAAKTNKDPKNWAPKRLQKHAQTAPAAMRLKQQRDDDKALKAIEPYRPYLLGVYHAIHLTGGGGNYTWHRRLAGTDWSANAENLRGLPIEKMCQLTGLTEPSLREHLRHLKKYDIVAFNNHKVVSIQRITGNFDVYDLSIEGPFENFALSVGISVHNSKDTTDACAGAYYNAINSDEKLTLASYNAPAVYSGQDVQHNPQSGPPVEIMLPAKGYTRSKVFHV